MEITNELDVQRHDSPDVWICSAFGYSDRSSRLRRRTGFCQNARQERPGTENGSSKIVAVLRHCVHKVR